MNSLLVRVATLFGVRTTLTGTIVVIAKCGNHGNHNMLNLGQHINDTQFAINKHYLDLLEMLVRSLHFIMSDKKHIATSAMKDVSNMQGLTKENLIFTCNFTQKFSK